MSIGARKCKSVLEGAPLRVYKSIGDTIRSEFLATLGINIGSGFAFREVARALLKIIPIFGNAASGADAATATKAIVEAAIAYFIEYKTAEEAKNILSERMPKQK